eukprot:2801743-Amphidinium_carterae.1
MSLPGGNRAHHAKEETKKCFPKENPVVQFESKTVHCKCTLPQEFSGRQQHLMVSTVSLVRFLL